MVEVRGAAKLSCTNYEWKFLINISTRNQKKDHGLRSKEKTNILVQGIDYYLNSITFHIHICEEFRRLWHGTLLKICETNNSFRNENNVCYFYTKQGHNLVINVINWNPPWSLESFWNFLKKILCSFCTFVLSIFLKLWSSRIQE